MKSLHIASFAGAGLFAGAFAWALHQQSGYVLASMVCSRRSFTIWAVSALAVVLLVCGALVSWRALRQNMGAEDVQLARPRRFMASIGLMACLLFLFAILLQASALLFLPSCAT